MEDIAAAIKLQIIEQELQSVRNTVYMIGLRIRVAKKIGNDTKALEEEMAKMLQMQDELEAVKVEVGPTALQRIAVNGPKLIS